MAHLPINHRLGPLYRFLAALAAFYLLVFGIVGAARTWGDKLFDRGEVEALGLRTNLAFSLLSIVAGAILLVGSLIGHNLDHFLNLAGGMIFWVAGLAMLVLLHTGANFLNFAVSTCVVSFIIGTVLFLAGLYGKRGTAQQAREEEAFRHSGRDATALHTPAHQVPTHPGVAHRQNPAT